MRNSGLRLGEKVLFGIAAAFVLFAIVSFVGMEIYRAHSGKKMYAATTHFDFSQEGLTGSVRFRDLGCTSCHRAVRNGTNNGVNLDGIGSKRSLDYLIAFLHQPEVTYGTQTMDHGPDKGAAYVARLPEQDLHSLAVFLSELKAVQGSPDARLPSEGRSGFIDEMVKIWAPSTWKSQYHDVREEGAPVHNADH
ncbi:MAG: c-type cytochrome [Steroidobacteraceae bacterium]